MPIHLRVASEVYIPKIKVPNPESIDNFQPIALLNIEGKLFFSLLSKLFEDQLPKRIN